jgi:hypothetical protein
MRRLIGMALGAGVLVSMGCVRRTITVLSEPPGALVWLNDREVGRTPVTVDFTFYGRYDVRLFLEGYEPMHTYGDAKSPWWDTIGIDLISEAVPGEPHADVVWSYTLSVRDDNEAGLRERANVLRGELAPQSVPATAPTEMPAAGPDEPAPAADAALE